ncbi:MBL fold metallo-hydrolase [Ideonella sp. BN130291]|uniref:MBL fold metallo-hydrolase n=1 Tax=Ideonella sp. BN130291 TaxID=3112940 RepID=UPI002E262540|nr:MBL fold metallo-hydrolase [Ideonella sp. BN130291]
MTPLPDFVEPLHAGLYAIDTGFHRPQFDAAYLIVHEGRAAFIDTGTNHAVPRLLQALASLNLAPDAVDYVIPTHVHLDHAGGAGLLMQQLPSARLVVHPRGARHMVDPSQLYQGALAVYGQAEMDRSYGTLVGVPAERVLHSSDGMTLQLAGRTLEFIDTPGHARHHHCIWDAMSQGWFTGDTFGLSYREFDTLEGAWIMPTSTPVQFEPEALRESVQRLLARQPRWMYLTHYGRVGDVPRLGQLLLDQVEAMVILARALRDVPERHQRLKHGLLALYQDRLAGHGINDAALVAELLAMDVELNAQGLGIWLDRNPDA